MLDNVQIDEIIVLHDKSYEGHHLVAENNPPGSSGKKKPINPKSDVSNS